MPKLYKAGWAVVTHDAYITHHPCYLTCVILTVEDSGDYLDVYEGGDPGAGRKILRLKALANRSVAFNFSTPVYCERGISVDFSTTDSEATIVWLAANEIAEDVEIL